MQKIRKLNNILSHCTIVLLSSSFQQISRLNEEKRTISCLWRKGDTKNKKKERRYFSHNWNCSSYEMMNLVRFVLTIFRWYWVMFPWNTQIRVILSNSDMYYEMKVSSSSARTWNRQRYFSQPSFSAEEESINMNALKVEKHDEAIGFPSLQNIITWFLRWLHVSTDPIHTELEYYLESRLLIYSSRLLIYSSRQSRNT